MTWTSLDSQGPTFGGSTVERTPDAVAATDLDPDIAAAWDLWSVQIGKAVAGVFPRLQDELPGLSSALACTADGLHLCSIGLQQGQVNRLSAFASSVFSMSGVAAGLVQTPGQEPSAMETVTLMHGNQHTLLFAVRNLIVGSILFALTSTDSMGLMLVQVRGVAEEVTNLLGNQ